MSEDPNRIRITSDDLENIQVDAPQPAYAPPQNSPGGSAPRQWGSVSGVSSDPSGANPAHASGGSFFLKSWVYLGLAGLAAAFLAWAICEPGVDDGKPGWGSALIIPLMVAAITVAFAVAESLIERSLQKAVTRGFLALVLGLVLGFIFTLIADSIFMLGLRVIATAGGTLTGDHPSFWFARAIGWSAFGVTGGIVYGIAGQSWKKCLYGILGGMLGAGIGGFLFDPIGLIFVGGAPSRCIGMMIFGATTGVAIGLVESALKNRWLYVSAGPLAGKQFILYKPLTSVGSQQTNDIYLFKDLSIAPTHATIELQGPNATLVATGPTFVSGQPVTRRALRSGDTIQIGRYTFQYQEKQTHG